MSSVKCPVSGCDHQLTAATQLENHLGTVHQAPYLCFAEACSWKAFESSTALSKHIATSHGSLKQWHCPSCPAVFHRRQVIPMHLYVDHLPGAYQCRKADCAFTSGTLNALLQHQVVKHTVRAGTVTKLTGSDALVRRTELSSAEVADAVTPKTLEDIAEPNEAPPRSTRKNTAQLMCCAMHCSEQFTSQEQLAKHLRSHPPSLTHWLCPFCEREIFYLNRYMTHLRQDHAELCRANGSAAKLVSILIYCLRCCTPAKGFRCRLCHFENSRVANVHQHIRGIHYRTLSKGSSGKVIAKADPVHPKLFTEVIAQHGETKERINLRQLEDEYGLHIRLVNKYYHVSKGFDFASAFGVLIEVKGETGSQAAKKSVETVKTRAKLAPSKFKSTTSTETVKGSIAQADYRCTRANNARLVTRRISKQQEAEEPSMDSTIPSENVHPVNTEKQEVDIVISSDDEEEKEEMAQEPATTDKVVVSEAATEESTTDSTLALPTPNQADLAMDVDVALPAQETVASMSTESVASAAVSAEMNSNNEVVPVVDHLLEEIGNQEEMLRAQLNETQSASDANDFSEDSNMSIEEVNPNSETWVVEIDSDGNSRDIFKPADTAKNVAKEIEAKSEDDEAEVVVTGGAEAMNLSNLVERAAEEEPEQPVDASSQPNASADTEKNAQEGNLLEDASPVAGTSRPVDRSSIRNPIGPVYTGQKTIPVPAESPVAPTDPSILTTIAKDSLPAQTMPTSTLTRQYRAIKPRARPSGPRAASRPAQPAVSTNPPAITALAITKLNPMPTVAHNPLSLLLKPCYIIGPNNTLIRAAQSEVPGTSQPAVGTAAGQPRQQYIQLSIEDYHRLLNHSNVSVGMQPPNQTHSLVLSTAPITLPAAGNTAAVGSCRNSTASSGQKPAGGKVCKAKQRPSKPSASMAQLPRGSAPCAKPIDTLDQPRSLLVKRAIQNAAVKQANKPLLQHIVSNGTDIVSTSTTQRQPNATHEMTRATPSATQPIPKSLESILNVTAQQKQPDHLASGGAATRPVQPTATQSAPPRPDSRSSTSIDYSTSLQTDSLGSVSPDTDSSLGNLLSFTQQMQLGEGGGILTNDEESEESGHQEGQTESPEPHRFFCLTDNCWAVFSEVGALSRHLLAHCGSNRWWCPLCEIRYTSRQLAQEHVSEHHQDDLDDRGQWARFVCMAYKCNADFERFVPLANHLQFHTPPFNSRRFWCPVCHIRFIKRVDGQAHLEQLHANYLSGAISQTDAREHFRQTRTYKALKRKQKEEQEVRKRRRLAAELVATAPTGQGQAAATRPQNWYCRDGQGRLLEISPQVARMVQLPPK